MLAESALRRNIVDSVVAHAWLGRWRVLVCCVALCCDCAGRGEVSELGRAEAMMRGSFAWCSRTDGPSAGGVRGTSDDGSTLCRVGCL